MNVRNVVLLGLMAGAVAVPSRAGDRSAAAWAATAAAEYGMSADLTYLTASGVELKLDVYAPRGSTTPHAVVVYFHGGGWGGGST